MTGLTNTIVLTCILATAFVTKAVPATAYYGGVPSRSTVADRRIAELQLPVQPTGRSGAMLQVKSSGMCIDNAGSKKPGARLQGWKCNPRNLNQRFSLIPHKNKRRSVSIQSRLSKLCIVTHKQSKKSGAGIVQTACTGKPDHAWEIANPAGSDWFRLRAQHSGMCLTLTPAKQPKHSGRLAQMKCDRQNPDQEFTRNG